MKTLILAVLVAAFTINTGNAQDDKSKRKSPPAEATATIGGGIEVTVNYSKPSVKGRTLWGDLVPYGKVWRTGANEATTISFSKDVKVGDKNIGAGTYSLFMIPGKDSWTVIINEEAEQWGAYKYDSAKDAARTSVEPSETKKSMEQLTFTVGSDGKVTMHWGTTMVSFMVSEI